MNSFLRTELYEFNLQYEASQRLDNDQKLLLDQVLTRIDSLESSHEKRTHERKEYLDKLNWQLDNYLDLNKELASRYRYIKYFAYNRRMDLMKIIEQKLGALVNMKDKRQVISLQQRMHNALNDFFKFRSNFNLVQLKNQMKNYLNS